jgi:transcriptional regulator with XRE-family HTH domain
MERGWLEQQLEAGRSIESIARELKRDPSTVAYWVNKHGLASGHAAKHAAKGGITRDTLAPLVEAGLSTRQIAARLGLSQSTVRHWLRRHDLATARATRRRLLAIHASADDSEDATADCPRHGRTQFRRRSEGGWRCLKCRAEAVVARRRAVKAALVAEAGGACALCGYDRSLAALQFHHVDPAGKLFNIAHRGVARSMSAARKEAAKCVLLCANCHAEVEGGVATIPESTG